jgi:hypothetical protein
MVATPAMVSAMCPLTAAIEAADIRLSSLEVVRYVYNDTFYIDFELAAPP